MTQALAFPRYTLEIDEEGYPLFDGLRVNDEKLCQALFQSVRRLDSNSPSSALVADCEGELCLINPFDVPWVAQSVDDFDAESCVWNFLGECRERIQFESLSVDEWNRIHAERAGNLGSAVLSRKAQAAFLLNDATNSLSLKKFQSAEVPVSESAFWSELYAQEVIPWNLGKASPVLEAHGPNFLTSLKPGSRILVPGSGHGFDAEFFSQRNFEVFALDSAENAKKDFVAKHPQSKVHFEKADVFQWLAKRAEKSENEEEKFDAIFEHTFFCAIDPERREEYLNLVKKNLKKNAFWFGIFFLRGPSSRPPFGLSQWELRERIKKDFKIRIWELAKNSIPNRWGKELWAELKLSFA